ncbi:MAG TPA: hypothetical protein VFZ29_09225 [Solirubrobacterales bacterium]
MAAWLNQEGHIRTKSDLTGIHEISVATAHDWICLARRRGFVVAWHDEAASPRRAGSHWELTERGEQAIHSRLREFLARFPYASLVPLLLTGGGLVAALNWLARHPAAIFMTVYILLVALLVVAVSAWFSRSEKRENPGIAVVAIETLRSAGKVIPAL